MDFPSIKLNVIKKIEWFLVLKKLNKNFVDQRKKGSILPTWEVEKKILYWTYENHKHLGSPILIDYFTLPAHSSFREKLGLSEDELEKVQIRKVLGNLEAKGYAKFFVKKRKFFSQPESALGPDNIDQYNCDGVTITKEGISIGEILDYLYRLSNISKIEKYGIDYGSDKILVKKKIHFFTMNIQLVSLNMLYIVAVGFLVFEFLNVVGLVDNVANLFGAGSIKEILEYFIIIFSLTPFILFLISFFINSIDKLFYIKKNNMKKRNKILLSVFIPVGIIIILALVYFLFLFDIGLNSKYFVSKDFNNLFKYRQTGNCESFLNNISENYRDKWEVKCLFERQGANPLEYFEIKEISIAKDLAYLQVELDRDYTDSDKENDEHSYVASYEMRRTLEFPFNRWVLNMDVSGY